MSNINIAASVIEAENREELKAVETIEEKLKIAFAGARNHWMFTDEDTQFKGAIGAAMIGMEPDSEDYRRIECELQNLRNLSAMFSGVPVDVENMLSDEYEPFGLIKMWKDAQ